MKGDMVSHDVRALRVASKLRRRVKKKAANLEAQSPETKRARLAVLAINRRLKDAIDTLEARRSAFAAVIEQMRNEP
ncbi:MAG TPA: hypothetical protein VE914_10995 [Candidatus Angelobacter sp.]|nr:hypothetical protein [Candidatus Angelobacter sp.]